MNDEKNIELMKKAIELYEDGAILECKSLLIEAIDNITEFEEQSE